MTVFFNEFHYDNAGADSGEFVEIAGPVGTDLTGWRVVFYNGSNGATYGTEDLTGLTLTEAANGIGTVVVERSGIQNGSPDGFALVDAEDNVRQFLSYEGSFTATDGPAAGLTSTDVGVAETSSTPEGVSLQLGGTGRAPADFAWAAPQAETPGAVNAGQTFAPAEDDSGDDAGGFTLELLHIADQEASSDAVAAAPNLSAVMNALQAQDLGDDGAADNTIRLSSGDAFIPGVFFSASEAVFGQGGIADIQIQNELGMQAIALGNHEFDFGPEVLAQLISGTTGEGTSGAPIGTFDALETSDLAGTPFGGTDFPYLSTNLNFDPEPALAPLAVPGGQAPMPRVVTSSTVVSQTADGDALGNGDVIGVVGATTPTLASISSAGEVGILPTDFDATPTDAQLDALAAEIQTEVDSLLANNDGMNKVVLLSHMQQISIEQALAERLTGVDIIVAGGSNTRLADDSDRLRDGEEAQGVYPQFYTGADGNPVALVNTDGSYKYVGRLVLDFDAEGRVIPESYDADVSGAYATDDQGVADLGGGDLVDPEIQAIADAIEAQIIETESNVFGVSEVFLNGNRAGDIDDPQELDGVRTQETNLGNLTADANLAAAREIDGEVVLSIKNGGGIRASIGETVVPAGGTEAVRQPNPALTDSDGDVIKPQGGISQNDIETTLAFNNNLVLLTLTAEEIVGLLEYGVSALPDVAGQFPQIAGVEFSYDPDQPEGQQIRNAGIFAEDGSLIAELVVDGEIQNPEAQFRVSTLGFLAEPRFDDDGNFIGGGDGYPFPNINGPDAERINYVELDADETEATRDGTATFADDGTEQDALAEYLADSYATEETAFDAADIPRTEDARIQNLRFREDAVFDEAATGGPLLNEILGSTTGADSEYIELTGTPGSSLAGLSVVVVESDDQSSNGAIDFRYDFADGAVFGDNGFYLVANDTAAATYGVTPDATLPDGAIENSSYTIALVETASLSGDVVSGGEVVRDAVGVTDGEGASFFAFGAPVVGPDGSFLPAGVGRIEDGVDTDTAADWQILDFNNGAPNDPTAGGTVDPGQPDAVTLISEIQGDGRETALAGETVTVEAVVTADFVAGLSEDDDGLRGFYLQEEDADADGDAATSEGLFVFAPDADVTVGDTVRVTGTVGEFGGQTQLGSVSSVEVLASGSDLPTAAEIEFPVADLVEIDGALVADLEAYEGMRVTLPQELTVGDVFDTDRFGTIDLSANGRVPTYTQVNAPSVEGFQDYLAEQAANAIVLDDGQGSQNPSRLPFEVAGQSGRIPGELDALDPLRSGDTITGLEGILGQGFGQYRVQPTEVVEFENANPRPEEAPDVGGSLKVATFNVLNYFTSLGDETVDGAPITVGPNGDGPRGADTVEEFTRQTDKIVAALGELDADVFGLVELENEFADANGDGEVAIASLAAELSAQTGSNFTFADPGTAFVGGDAISAGIIYNADTVRIAPGTEVSFLEDSDLAGLGLDFGNPVFNGPGTSRSPLAASFEELATGEVFTLAVNHFKSKGSVSPFGDNAGIGDGTGNNNEARLQAAQALDAWLAGDPTGSGDDDVMITGDLNAYLQEDPIQYLLDQGYESLATDADGDAAYTYGFPLDLDAAPQVQGFGTLDYALANDSLAGQVTGAANWHINADEPSGFDYDTDFQPDDQVDELYADGPFRSSDHDPVLVGLDLASDGGAVERVAIEGRAGQVDRLTGTDADEVLDGRGGPVDILTGGGGSDVFVFDDTAGRDRLIINDYAAEDLIDLNGAEIAGARSLGNNLSLDMGDGDSVLVRGVGDLEDITFVDEMQLA